jgi:hypothetical protein
MTAVEWFNDEIIIHLNFDQRLYLKDILKQAIQLEKQQQDEFAIDFIKWTISKEAGDLIHDLKMVGEVSKIPTAEEVFKVYKRFKNK